MSVKPIAKLVCAIALGQVAALTALSYFFAEVLGR
jgi:hypothetical protein